MYADIRPQTRTNPPSVSLPPQLVAGLTLIAIAWPLAWSHVRPYSDYTFFPLWLGYILTVDGLVKRRTSTSLLHRDPRRWGLLFLASAPLWWLFEGLNSSVANWNYRLPRHPGTLEYLALASLSFSTVVPAVFETAELYRSFPAFNRPRCWLRIAPPRAALLSLVAAGAMMCITTFLFPRQAYPLVWLGLFFMLDPLNQLIGANSISGQIAHRRWDTVWVLCAAGLTCGFFWEMWNIFSIPKWTYEIPYIEGPKLFEMPLPGYSGYLPFALEIYAFYQTFHFLLFRGPDRNLQFDRAGVEVESVAVPATINAEHGR